ncbi:MAG TPA: hypothetical protein VF306_01765 [Pirellulales bacterium]
MLTRTASAATLLLLMAASAVLAQPPGRRGGGFGRRGFGGDENQASAAALLRMPEVRRELGVSDEQNSQVDEALAALNEQLRASFGNFQELQGLDEDERAKRLTAAREASEAAQKKADEKLAGILNAEQLARLEELRLQREGSAALLRPEVANKLGLSDEQRRQLGDLQAKARGAGAGGANFQQMSEDERREFFAQMQQRREAADKQMLAVLTAEQRQTIDEMKGEAFTFPPPPSGFGGGFAAGGGRFGPGGGAAERQRPPIKQRQP